MTKIIAVADGWEYSAQDTATDSPSVLVHNLLRAFEGGILDTLYENGCICFSDGIEYAAEAAGIQERGDVLFAAREAGATVVIVFEAFVETGVASAGVRAEGHLYAVEAGGRVISELAVESFSTAGAAAVGREAARSLVSALFR